MRAFTAVVNPISGGGRASTFWEPVALRLRAAGAAVATEATRGREHAVEIATRAAARGDVVVAVGGDGLVRDVAGGVVAAGGTAATMGIVPAGRGNDFAATLGLPTDPAALSAMLLDAPVRTLDVMDVNGVIAPGNVYVGVDSVATQIINTNRWMPALLLYRLAGVLAISRWRPCTFTVVTDGVSRTVAARSVVVANSGAYGHGLRIVPPAVLDDGLLHVMVVGDGPKRDVVGYLAQSRKGTHVHRPEVELSTAQVVTIDVDRPLPLCADGDEVGLLPATIRIRKAALRVIAPG
ncbi:diacylglycerol/lipid kinase family protein [Pseudonocardia sp. GCM10023141]|uniref:diacylglycerol/lipid kinase family protein n=1 Tax=Pseudonocardia sp. GCM10023141 TaxID=3252653 RepID=UPI0036146C9A